MPLSPDYLIDIPVIQGIVSDIYSCSTPELIQSIISFLSLVADGTPLFISHLIQCNVIQGLSHILIKLPKDQYLSEIITTIKTISRILKRLPETSIKFKFTPAIMQNIVNVVGKDSHKSPDLLLACIQMCGDILDSCVPDPCVVSDILAISLIVIYQQVSFSLLTALLDLVFKLCAMPGDVSASVVEFTGVCLDRFGEIFPDISGEAQVAMLAFVEQICGVLEERGRVHEWLSRFPFESVVCLIDSDYEDVGTAAISFLCLLVREGEVRCIDTGVVWKIFAGMENGSASRQLVSVRCLKEMVWKFGWDLGGSERDWFRVFEVLCGLADPEVPREAMWLVELLGWASKCDLPAVVKAVNAAFEECFLGSILEDLIGLEDVNDAQIRMILERFCPGSVGG
jgi:hypothetical protein